MVGGEGHTVPERVGPRGADNAANLVLACLPCAQAVNPSGRRPLPKKKSYYTACLAGLFPYQLVNTSQATLSSVNNWVWETLVQLLSEGFLLGGAALT